MRKRQKYEIVMHYLDGKEVYPPSKYDYVQSNSEDKFGKNLRFLLPTQFAEELEAKAVKEQVLTEEVNLEEAVEFAKQEHEKEQEQEQAKLPPVKREIEELRARHSDEHFIEVEIFEESEKQKLLDRSASSSDLNFKRRNKEITTKLEQLGNVRVVLRPFSRNKINEPSLATLLKSVEFEFMLLQQSNPQFSKVIDIYRQAVTISLRENRPFSVPPILLVGLPGIGKSHFARELSKVLRLPMNVISFDTPVTSSEIMGSSQYWGNTHYGKMFETICMGDVANPFFLLEEIDKAASYGENRSAINSLHVLLESSTSKKVTDVSVNITFDASYVTWLATANTIKNILPSLLSRFNVIYISAPNGRDSLQIARDVSAKMCAEAGCASPSRSIISMLACFSPREQMKALRLAILQAKSNERDTIEESDFASEFLAEFEEITDSVLDESEGLERPKVILH